jgi:uncharacterized membrane protein
MVPLPFDSSRLRRSSFSFILAFEPQFIRIGVSDCTSSPDGSTEEIMEKNYPILEVDTSGVGNHRQARLLSSQEGRILLMGLVLAMMYFVWLALDCPLVSEGPEEFIPITAALVILGRAAGMSLGYAMDMGPRVVVLFSMFIEAALVLLFYPLFVLTWRRLLVIHVLRRFMKSTHRIAEDHREAVLRFGIPGLLFFVWFPFWMTGPLVGCVIGFLLGLRTWVNLTVVLTATFLAIVSWAILLQKIHYHVVAYNPYAPVVLVAILIVILVGVYLVRNTYRKKRSSKRQDEARRF